MGFEKKWGGVTHGYRGKRVFFFWFIGRKLSLFLVFRGGTHTLKGKGGSHKDLGERRVSWSLFYFQGRNTHG
jgi:hypothetical protein